MLTSTYDIISLRIQLHNTVNFTYYVEAFLTKCFTMDFLSDKFQVGHSENKIIFSLINY